jgi:hypothetical protein
VELDDELEPESLDDEELFFSDEDAEDEDVLVDSEPVDPLAELLPESRESVR